MSNLHNDQIKEKIYDDLLEAGFDDDQIEELDMVDNVFFHDMTEADLWSRVDAVNADLAAINEDAFGG